MNVTLFRFSSYLPVKTVTANNSIRQTFNSKRRYKSQSYTGFHNTRNKSNVQKTWSFSIS